MIQTQNPDYRSAFRNTTNIKKEISYLRRMTAEYIQTPKPDKKHGLLNTSKKNYC